MDHGPILEDAYRRAERYLAALPDRRVAPTDDAVAALTALREPLPRSSTPASEVLALLDAVGSPATVASAGPRYFGFVTGGTLPVALGAQWLASVWDQNAAFAVMSPVASVLEQVTLSWLVELFGLPPDTGGAFVTGATMANLTCLGAARHALYHRIGWDVESEGLGGAPPLRIVVGEEAHVTVFKALGVLGFGRSRVERVPVDDQGRLRADQLPTIDDRTIVCLQAGNVTSGASDPFVPVCKAAHNAGAWVHVDGAFGLWAAASPTRSAGVEGVALADSWATDAHKWLNTSYDSGIALVRDAVALRGAFAVRAAYLAAGEGPDHRDPSDWTPDTSRRARVVEVWAALRSLGREGIAEMIDRCCALATRFRIHMVEAGFQVLNEAALNQVVVDFGDAERTARIIAAVQREGTCWAGSTVWRGRTAMRFSVSNWSTTAADIDRSAVAIIGVARSL